MPPFPDFSIHFQQVNYTGNKQTGGEDLVGGQERGDDGGALPRGPIAHFSSLSLLRSLLAAQETKCLPHLDSATLSIYIYNNLYQFTELQNCEDVDATMTD